MRNTPRAVLFDVNETLSDLTPLAERFEDVGVPRSLMPGWFAGVLRDGFALTAAGAYADFRSVARAGLRTVLRGAGTTGDPEDDVEHVLNGLAELTVHPDVPEGVRGLHTAGFRLATMTNGSAAGATDLLARAGLADCFEAHLDVSGPQAWKPSPAAYRYALSRLGLDPREAVLVAVHPWDVDGALRAGLGAVWLRRLPLPYPEVFRDPDRVVSHLGDLPAALGAGGTGGSTRGGCSHGDGGG
ncbi:haloacid dehalogenase type II [Streptomyces sp. TR06-5]|uniref:haloacid dehalogenase type II n=1 Tax=unclassified Streptomyces TaxID=2593676 RepID=UPI00399F7F75